MRQAQKLGVNVRKKWMATLDNRTRDAHASLDGQEKDVDEPFESDLGPIMYPGDPSADPGNVWNCRCTLVYVYPDYPDEAVQRRDNETGEIIGNMTYRKWESWKKEQASAPYGIIDVAKDFGLTIRAKLGIIDIAEEALNITRGAPMDTATAILSANPRHGSSDEYDRNCQRCVQAFEYRKRGYNVSARPNIGDDSINWGTECFIGTIDMDKAKREYTLGQTSNAVKREIANAPDGARYSIYIQWRNSLDTHVLVAEKTDGRVSYLDPQTGDFNVERYFKEGVPGRFGFFRMDDKPLTTNPDIVRKTLEAGQ